MMDISHSHVDLKGNELVKLEFVHRHGCSNINQASNENLVEKIFNII